MSHVRRMAEVLVENAVNSTVAVSTMVLNVFQQVQMSGIFVWKNPLHLMVWVGPESRR